MIMKNVVNFGSGVSVYRPPPWLFQGGVCSWTGEALEKITSRKVKNLEHRLIYHILNVLESLHEVSRSAKNHYSWHSWTKLCETLAILKHVCEKHRYGQQIQQIGQRIMDREFDFNREEKEN
ncbi:hypothetical protein GOODEAATRI_020384 [Goodea atripinnis]|uniref:E2F/DP family winged-helix DNA-binding domain-containing protein n=1 Tax=Goodea atripinnis TaxID=208336 RepID=A0ABV0MTM9_9TELE